jgi:hypothetical protein
VKPQRQGGGGITSINSIAKGPRLNALPVATGTLSTSTSETVISPFESPVLSSKKKPAYYDDVSSAVEPSSFCLQYHDEGTPHNNLWMKQSSTILQDEEKRGPSWLDQCFDNLSDIGVGSSFFMEHDNNDDCAAAGVGMPFDDNKLPPGDIIDEIISTFGKSSNPPQLETTHGGRLGRCSASREFRKYHQG